MTRHFSRFAAVVLTVILFQGGNSAFAQRKDVPPGGASKNNSKILDVFKSVVAKAANSTVSVMIDGKQVALGAIVKADGYILTKDSELRSDDIVVKFKDGKELPAKKISSNDNWDLAMLKVDAANLQPVVWVDSKADPVGNWVATPAPADKPIAVGIVSVAARNIPGAKMALPKNMNQRGFLGIQMETDEKSSGVKIVKVTAKSPAEKAGLKADDIIIGVDGKDTVDRETLAATIGRHKPGDTVTIRYRRGDSEDEAKATLGKPPADFGFDRGDFQNSMGTDRSERRTGFASALQHDTDLKASQCGGPLVDLEGRVIGINIARGGRTDTYALPAEAIKPLLADLFKAKVSSPVSANKALTDKIKAAKALLKSASTAKAAAEKKLADAKAALEELQDQSKTAVKDAEDAKAAADKKLAAAKAALEKLQGDLKKENDKK